MNKIIKRITYTLFVIILIITSFIIVNSINNIKKEEIENKINNNYGEYVKVNKKTYLYIKEKDKYNFVGMLSKGTILNLESKKSEFYQIKGTKYYVSYKNVYSTEKNDIENLIPFNLNATTDDSFNLYKNNKIAISLNQSIDVVIYEQNEKYYYVKFLNEFYYIKKTDIKNTYAYINTNIELASYIPVLYIQKTSNDNCYNTCIKEKNRNQYLQYISENNYKTISLEIYNKWVNGEVNLEKNSILLISEDITNNYDLIINKGEAKITNKASTVGNNESYVINNNTATGDFLNMLSGVDIINKNIDDSIYANSIAVLNYHFFYDKKANENCHENICEDIADFESHLKYLNDNGYKALTLDEFIAWMYGEIELPKKSVLITVDDGAFGTSTHLPYLLDKYQINATLFLVTGWWNRSIYKSNYLSVESHSNAMHTNGTCKNPKILCLSKDEIKDDLRTSIKLVGSNKAFCYPFYKYNETAIEAIKEEGFKIAFTGGSIKATKESNKYAIPRYEIFNNMKLKDIIKMIE